MLFQNLFEKTAQSTIWGLFGFILLGIIIHTFWGYLRSVLLSLKLPGPPTAPLVGHCLLIKEKDLMVKRVATAFIDYGAVIKLWILIIPFFAILQPDDIQLILSSKKHTNKTFFYRFMHNFLGNGLITSNGEKWQLHRHLLQPIFHLNILESYINTYADAAQELFEVLNVMEGQDINIAKYINNCVMDILNEIVLGVPVKKKYDINMQQSPFRQGKVVVPQRLVRPWLLLDSIYRLTKLASDELYQKQRLNDFTRKMIKQRREMRENNIINNNNNNNNNNRNNSDNDSDNNYKAKCLLDYMIEISDTNPKFTEEDIVNEACTFMLAGQDSVGAALAFTLFLLTQHKDCQQKCTDEIERIFANDTRKPTMQDLRQMRYLEMCIKESLRLCPSVPVMARKLGEDVHLKDYTIPSGSNIFISPYATHRLPHIYPEPEKFDPERFSPENVEKRHPYAFLPFSAGPRYCIGNRFAIMEIKTIISRLLRSFELLPVPGKATYLPTFRITLRASGGLWLQLKSKPNKLLNYNT